MGAIAPGPGSYSGDHFGSRIDGAGDVNGDGFADLIVGIPGATWAPPGGGLAAIYFGSPTGFVDPPGVELWGPPVVPGVGAEQFASAVAGIGDVNGDGFDDVAVTSPRFTPRVFESDGKVSIYFGGSAGPGALPDQELVGGFEQGLGHTIGRLGDVNGDGFDDLGVESLRSGPRLEVFHGSPTGLLPPTTRIDQPTYAVSTSLVAAGDVNGDGFGDVLLRSQDFSHPESNEGAVALHLGSSTWISLTPAWSVEGDADFALLGSVAVGAGDLDADGFDDVVISRTVADTPTMSILELHRGHAGGLEAAPSWRFEHDVWPTPWDGILMIARVIAPGDINCDGYRDLVVGLPGAAGATIEEGEVVIIAGAAGGLENAPSCRIVLAGSLPYRSFGRTLASVGDVDADGLPDFVVGAPGHVSARGRVPGSFWLFAGDCDPACATLAPAVGPCAGVPLAMSASDPDGDMLSVAWRSSCGDAVFSPDALSWSPTVSLPNACDTTCEVVATVRDGRGGSCESPMDVLFTDREAPILSEVGDVVARFWSPNHRMACVPVTAFHPPVRDNCSDSVTLKLVGCQSSQPDDSIGDGSTDTDCTVSADGNEVCLRAERSGVERAGRTYQVFATGTDICGNESIPVVAGLVLVPHDQRGGAVP